MNKPDIKKLYAFTLAEILFTIVIIGIIFALTLPALQVSLQNAEYKNAYRKTISDANQALTKMKENYELSGGDRLNTIQTRNNHFQFFMNKFQVNKQCLSNNNSNCFINNGEKINGIYPFQASYAFLDNLNRAWSMPCPYNSGACGDIIIVDTNANNGPNKFGRDRWVLELADINNNHDAGLPIKIQTPDDCPKGSNCAYCPSGDCMYESWINN